MEITPPTTDLSTSYLAPFLGLTGDRRTAAPLAATVRGIVASQSLVCAHRGVSPPLAAGRHSERRIRRMLHGETTTRSALDPDAVTAKLWAHGVDRLSGEAAIWVILDESDVRKPHATAMEGVQPVKRLGGQGTGTGYRTLNALGLAPDKRGVLSHRLFSSATPDFASESEERRRAIGEVSAALAPLKADVTWILDSGFDAVALWSALWAQDATMVYRLQHHDR